MQTIKQLLSGELAGTMSLKLSENLTSVPVEILSLADTLEILDLSGNQLAHLPDFLTQLPKLRIIFASNNLFETLPEVLGRCKNLEMVGFKENQISYVPESSLPAKLRWLILTNNQLQTLPDSLGQRSNLQKLALAGNKLTCLPASLVNSSKLELLRISANEMTEFPEQLLSLPKLAWFAFAGNPFSQSSVEIKSVPLVKKSSYQLQQVLGQGASGVISKAKWLNAQTDFPDEIAVKVFKGEITSDGYPEDELQACLKVKTHPNLVQSLAQVKDDGELALVMDLIPHNYMNLGLPPSFSTCTRDTFSKNFTLPITKITKIVQQMTDVFEHLHDDQVCHGDLYAHNTLIDEDANIIFGDFGAATMYHMLTDYQQQAIKQIEQRALYYFIDDLLTICADKDKKSEDYDNLKSLIS